MQRTKSSTLVKNTKKNDLKPAMVAKTTERQKTSAAANLQEAGSTVGMSHQAVKTDAAPSAVKTSEKTYAKDFPWQEILLQEWKELSLEERAQRSFARLEQDKKEMQSKRTVPQDPKTRQNNDREKGGENCRPANGVEEGRKNSLPIYDVKER